MRFVTPQELKKRYPLSNEQAEFISKARAAVREILSGKDRRLILVVGPCSIHDLKGAEEYARRLKLLSSEVKDSFLIVMRAYFEKPRTALGWKGLVHDPFLDGSHQMARGYEIARELLLHLAAIEVPTACEFLDPPSSIYNGDLITWGCIGARTSTSQIHRQMASDLPMPVAFKNSTDGNIQNAVNGCLAATYPHTFLGLNEEGFLSIHHSKGNPDAHVVLRGGENRPNYDRESIQYTLQLLRRASLGEKVLIDCSHDNCKKKHELQKAIFDDVLKTALAGYPVKGLMLESYLGGGNQPLKGPLSDLSFGISVTDPCLSWEETESLIQDGHIAYQQYHRSHLPMERDCCVQVP